MMIIGVDPGSHKTGWGVIEEKGGSLRYVESGVIATSPEEMVSLRLKKIHEVLAEVVRRCQPDQAAVEEGFYCKNARSALPLGHARGVALLALRDGGCGRVFEYAAKKIKMSVVGIGSADKRQIQHMVRAILGIRKQFAAEDESDALAAAICHAHNKKNAAAVAGEI